MGLSLMRLLAEFPELKLHAAVASQGSAVLGRDSGELAGVAPSGIPLTADLKTALKDASLAIDFSTESTSRRLVAMCAESGTALLIGTTGLGSDLPALIGKAAGRIPLLVAANTSVGAAVLEDLVRRAAATLGMEFTVRCTIGITVTSGTHLPARRSRSGQPFWMRAGPKGP